MNTLHRKIKLNQYIFFNGASTIFPMFLQNAHLTHTNLFWLQTVLEWTEIHKI